MVILQYLNVFIRWKFLEMAVFKNWSDNIISFPGLSGHQLQNLTKVPERGQGVGNVCFDPDNALFANQ